MIQLWYVWPIYQHHVVSHPRNIRILLSFIMRRAKDKPHQTMTTNVLRSLTIYTKDNDTHIIGDLKSVYVDSPSPSPPLPTKSSSCVMVLSFYHHVLNLTLAKYCVVVHLQTDLCWQITDTQIMFAWAHKSPDATHTIFILCLDIYTIHPLWTWCKWF